MNHVLAFFLPLYKWPGDETSGCIRSPNRGKLPRLREKVEDITDYWIRALPLGFLVCHLCAISRILRRVRSENDTPLQTLGDTKSEFG